MASLMLVPYALGTEKKVGIVSTVNWTKKESVLSTGHGLPTTGALAVKNALCSLAYAYLLLMSNDGIPLGCSRLQQIMEPVKLG
eukprot:scaffold128626_cov21-Tisochrysis_lutea.AAC.3